MDESKTLVAVRIKEGDWLSLEVKSESAKRFTYLARTLGFAARWYEPGEAVPDYVKPANDAQVKLIHTRIGMANRERQEAAA